MEFEARRKVPPIVSVDVPSGWNVDEGNPNGRYFSPQVLLSLTAPKLGVRSFTMNESRPGRHFLGGRFVPDDVEEQFCLALPAYPADAQIVEVTGFGQLSIEEARQRLAEEEQEGRTQDETRAQESRGAAPT